MNVTKHSAQRSGPQASTNSRKAFTLIELLVVIAIISLLVSILLPSLKKAQDLAKAVTCKANMKSMFMGYSLYQNDSDMLAPAIFSNNAAGTQIQWRLLLMPYLDDQPTPEGGYDGSVKFNYQCPEAKASHGRYDGASIAQVNLAWDWAGWNYEKLADPSNSIQNTEAFFYKNIAWFDWTICSLWGEVNKIPEARHIGGVNLLFADGHVEDAVSNDSYVAGWPDVPWEYWSDPDAKP